MSPTNIHMSHLRCLSQYTSIENNCHHATYYDVISNTYQLKVNNVIRNV